MPRENRKRGKRHNKNLKAEPESQPQRETINELSWIRPADYAEDNPEAPYGYVDNDVKAYFRTVDVQIRDWQESRGFEAAADDDKDPNEERHLFFMAALAEMSGKERQLATDPECSVVLERMAHSMDDFVRRVFIDSLAGSFISLAKHRFASHVCQTMFTVAGDTISRETRGIMPGVTESSEHGELRTMTQLIFDVCKELLPSINSLIMDPFASHVVRSLFVLLTPTLATDESSTASLRSKRSQKWKSKQGPMTSVFTTEKGRGKEPSVSSVPAKFSQAARQFVERLRQELSDNEVRALATSKVASPALKMLIKIEADHDLSAEAGSLMDSVLMGTISSCLKDKALTSVEAFDFVAAMLRDQASSHLLETVIARCPDHVFAVLWMAYFSGKLQKLAVHPVANFVVSRAIGRVSAGGLTKACQELEGSWNRLLKSMRIVVLKTIIERAAELGSCEDAVIQAVYSAFEFTSAEEKVQLVPCVLHLVTITDYQANKPTLDDEKSRKPQGRNETTRDTMEPTSHGSQLLQALLRLSAPHNEVVIDSLTSLSVEERITLAHNVYSSRIFDVLLESPSVLPKAKRKIVMDFIGSYHLLVDNRIGSHIVDRCWERADTYLKEKIARSLFAYDKDLAASYYGRFFARNLNLQLLQRRPNEWRDKQAERKNEKQKEQKETAASRAPTSIPETKTTTPENVDEGKVNTAKRKRPSHNSKEDNEIDSLFSLKIRNRVKRTTLERG
ncbi:hypothetical protein AX15_004626 [Amanita polypyramis BW_CC]|nr:hypothetical protein AX15_004626 [Amanita polypyramis BW_CC]